jgi:pre-mRNA-splicing factor ATP-dependent RNA helicase DHX15/PRP43
LDRANHYITIKDDQIVALHPSCVLTRKPQFVLYDEFVLTSKNYIRTVTDVGSGDWLLEVAPNYFNVNNFKSKDVRRVLERLTMTRNNKMNKY